MSGFEAFFGLWPFYGVIENLIRFARLPTYRFYIRHITMKGFCYFSSKLIPPV